MISRPHFVKLFIWDKMQCIFKAVSNIIIWYTKSMQCLFGFYMEKMNLKEEKSDNNKIKKPKKHIEWNSIRTILGVPRRKLHAKETRCYFIFYCICIYRYIGSWYTASAVVDGPAGGQIMAGDPKNRASSS